MKCTWGGAPCINFEESKEKEILDYCDTPDILNRFCKDFDKKNVDQDKNNGGLYEDKSHLSDPCVHYRLFFQDSETSVKCQKISECGVEINDENIDKCIIFELSLAIEIVHSTHF